MGTPLKVSDGLFALARQESQATQRSITAQVEHWARIGRAVEAILAHQELLTLKQVGELLTPAFPSKLRREEVHDLLHQIADSPDRNVTKAALRASATPVYAADPDHPERILQVRPDGTRISGRMEGRRFVPAEDPSTQSKL